MELSAASDRRAFAHWVRTGRLPCGGTAQAIELKFNPYHDPRNGRFTFAPGGPSIARSVNLVRRSAGTARAGSVTTGVSGPATLKAPELPASTPAAPSTVAFAPTRPGPPMGRGSNSRAFEKPMTLEQAFPGLRNAPGGAIIAVADGFFDFTGPANAAIGELADNYSRQIKAEIKSIDPNWRYDRLGPVETIQGKINELNDLRFRRAEVYLRVKGDARPLQVETLQYVQARADIAYARGLAKLTSGRLRIRLSDQEALGNFIDREVRKDLRERLGSVGINWRTNPTVRVNAREYDTSGTDRTYRRPDARVARAAFDVTLTRKTATTPQVKGFFNADFQPSSVIIIRPSQLGADHTYAIPRPETKR